MVPLNCPGDAALLAWLQTPLDDEPTPPLASHFDGCAACQRRLAELEADEERRAAADGDHLLADLRCPPPPDALEAECPTTDLFAGAPHPAPRPARPAPDLADVAALTRRGHYELLGVLGQGGMGVVYRARNLKMNRLVAIKVLPPRKVDDPAALARFAREMRVAARLTHPNIVTTHDADEAEGRHFLAMEFIDGVDLKALVKERGPLPVELALDYLIQAARGLHHAHEHGIIHRDVKPANLMLTSSGTVKVLDLGLACFDAAEESPTDLTATGMMLGTADYLAPEQAENAGRLDRRADIYSLGCTLYFLLTGKPLYEGTSILQKALSHREKPIPSPRASRPETPAELERVFVRMVAKRPEGRHATMAEVIADLEHVRAGLGTAPLPTPGGNRGGRPGTPRRLGWAAAALLFLLLGGIAWMNRPGRSGDAAPPVALPPVAVGQVPGQEWEGNEPRMPFRWCPAGRFTMSCPPHEPGRTAVDSPPVDVVLTRGFWLGKFEVTQAEWECVLGSRPSRYQGEPTLPVENVTWAEATRFCATLTETERDRGALPDGWEYRLPTEAQWEYGCRAGTTTAYCFGNQVADLDDHAWHGYNADFRSHLVGQKKPNAWGLHDMHGNVWEWCRDWYWNRLKGGVDPEAREVSDARVMRGGGWNAAQGLCRSAFRTGQKPDLCSHLLGMRVALVRVENEP